MTGDPHARAGKSGFIDVLKEIGKAAFAVVLFLLLFVAMGLFLALFMPTPEQLKAQKELEGRERTVSAAVDECLSRQGPWRCFLALDAADVSDPVEGVLRTRELARLASAEHVLAFCTEPRKVDCADRMVGKAYSNEEILAALEE